MRISGCLLVFSVIVAACLGAPRIVKSDGKPAVEAGPTGNEETTIEPEVPEEDETERPLTSNQQGRLARFNGNFFELYGNTEAFAGNIEAFAGSQLRYRGDLQEFLGNEKSMSYTAEYLRDAQASYYEAQAMATGRRAEILKEQGDLGGVLAELVQENADLERNQIIAKKEQIKLEGEQLKLEKYQERIENEQAVLELEQGDTEEHQFEVEAKFNEVLQKHVDLQGELENLEAKPN